MGTPVVINATEELFQVVTTYKGGVPVSARYCYHTVNDTTGEVISTRQDDVVVKAADIAKDATLSAALVVPVSYADTARAAKDAAIAAEKAAIEAAAAAKDAELAALAELKK